MPFFYFFFFQAVDCLLNRARVSDMVEKGIGAPTVEDSGADTSLGLAFERKPKALLSVPPGASKPSQNNDVDIIGNEETPGLFEDFIKVDSSVHDFEIESGSSVPSTKCNVEGRSSGRCHYISEPRLKKYLVHIDKVLADPNVSARDLASLVGKIISMSAVPGNLSSIMNKHCQMSVAPAQDLDTPSPLDRYCIVELEFWKDSLRRLNSRDLFSCNPPFISV